MTVTGIVSAGLMVWMGAATEAVASCGDYLLPPRQFAQHMQVPTEYVAVGEVSPHSERPCRGPYCRRAPRPESPVPVPVTVVPTDPWACAESVTLQIIPDIALWRAPSFAVLVRDVVDRLDRPPRA